MGDNVLPGKKIAWQPTTYKEWLYDYYYNATKLGFDRDDWGGRVIKADDPAAAVNIDPDNLTLPIFAYKPEKLTDEYVNITIAKFFPGANISSMKRVTRTDRNGVILKVSVGNQSGTWEFLRNGEIDFDSNGPWTPGDKFNSNGSAKEYAIAWLKERQSWPVDVGIITIFRLVDYPFSTGATQYELTFGRKIMGFDFGTLGENVIRLRFEASTGRVVYFKSLWPDIRVPFFVTDLPSIDFVMKYHDLIDRPKDNITYYIFPTMEYRLASVFFNPYLDQTAPIYFYLPYRYICSVPFWYTDGYFGVIFPDKDLISIR